MEMQMNENTQEQTSPPEIKKLSPDAPVDGEVLQRLQQVQHARLQVADRLLDLEMEKVRLLASAQRIDNEKTRIFEGILMERGLPPNSIVEVDAETGIITDPRKRMAPPAPPPAS
jgi:hypothetical protein